MSVRLAIHEGLSRFAPRWVEYCRDHGIEYEIVDCYDVDIIARLREFDGLLWHFAHYDPTDLLMARHVLTPAEHMGLTVFPDMETCWHFDDKLAQKYLLEAVKAPVVPMYAFYYRETALAWLKTASFPLVRKLRRGAGSFNVGLVKDLAEGRRFCNRMFGKGISPAQRPFADTRRRLRQMSSWQAFRDRLRRLPAYLELITSVRRRTLPERGYVLFQEFMPDNAYDIRIAVVGDRAWGFTRDVRPGDFRASGSGVIDYNRDRIHSDSVKIAFTVAEALRSQSMAFDFVLNPAGEPMIVEMSFGYVPEAAFNAPGHWSPDLSWHEGHTWPEHAIVSDLVQEIERRKGGAI